MYERKRSRIIIRYYPDVCGETEWNQEHVTEDSRSVGRILTRDLPNTKRSCNHATAMLADKVMFRILMIHLAQNRDEWAAFMNIRVTLGMEICYASEGQELICWVAPAECQVKSKCPMDWRELEFKFLRLLFMWNWHTKCYKSFCVALRSSTWTDMGRVYQWYVSVFLTFCTTW